MTHDQSLHNWATSTKWYPYCTTEQIRSQAIGHKGHLGIVGTKQYLRSKVKYGDLVWIRLLLLLLQRNSANLVMDVNLLYVQFHQSHTAEGPS